MTGMPTEPEPPFFSAQDREWVAAKWALIRKHNTVADTANRKWRKLTDEVNEYLKRSGITDPVQVAHIKSENLALADHLALAEWNRREAQGHIADVNLFLRLKEHRLL